MSRQLSAGSNWRPMSSAMLAACPSCATLQQQALGQDPGAAEEVGRPAGPPHPVDERARGDPRRHDEAVALVALARSRARDVDRDDDRLVPGRPRALQQRLGQPAVAPDVELKPPRARTGRGHVLKGARRRRGEHVEAAGPVDGPGDPDLALVVHEAGEPGGRPQQRDLDAPAQHLGGEVDLGGADQHPRAQRQRLQVGLVALLGHLVPGGAVDVVEHAAGQAPPRQRAQVGDVDGTLGAARLRQLLARRLGQAAHVVGQLAAEHAEEAHTPTSAPAPANVPSGTSAP